MASSFGNGRLNAYRDLMKLIWEQTKQECAQQANTKGMEALK